MSVAVPIAAAVPSTHVVVSVVALVLGADVAFVTFTLKRSISWREFEATGSVG